MTLLSAANTHDSASSHAENKILYNYLSECIVEVKDHNTTQQSLWWLWRDQEPAVEKVGSRCRGWRTVPCVGLSRILSSPTSCVTDHLSGLQIQMLTLSPESMEVGKAAFCKVLTYCHIILQSIKTCFLQIDATQHIIIILSFSWMSGLVLGLLADSKHTKRYNKLQDFIRRGTNKAEIKVNQSVP